MSSGVGSELGRAERSDGAATHSIDAAGGRSAVGNRSAQPAHTPDIDVCPFLGRESEEPDGAPISLTLRREGGPDLRPSPSFRCLALPGGARIDAGRLRRLCLSARHPACRRYGDAEADEEVPIALPATPNRASDLAPADDEPDERMGRIRRRFGNRGKETAGPRAHVTVSGRPVDFTPMDEPHAGTAESTQPGDGGSESEADRLGSLWDDQVELDRLGAADTKAGDRVPAGSDDES